MKTTKAKMTITIDREAIRRRMPSELMKAALYRSGSGVHADQKGRYSKRDRTRLRQEERQALRTDHRDDNA